MNLLETFLNLASDSSSKPWDGIRDTIIEDRQKEMPWESQYDILAQSWASYHLCEPTQAPSYATLDSLVPSERDRKMAEKTRKHYLDRIMMDMLSNREPSEFKKELYRVLSSNCWQNQHRGMAYKLPYFYQEDMCQTRIKDMFSQKPFLSLPSGKFVYTIEPLEQTLVVRKSKNQMKYWWRNQNHEAVLWTVPLDNCLRNMLQNWFESGRRLRIHSTFHSGPWKPTSTQTNFWFNIVGSDAVVLDVY